MTEGADGMFAFGNADCLRSMGGTPLNKPETGFAFDAPFYGSRGSAGSAARFYAIASTSGGTSCLLVGQHDA
jgi:hypothetical protein